MLITCKCLNVSMDLGKIKPKGIPLASLKLTPLEESHEFFSEGVAEMEQIVGISKQIAALTVSHTIGNWIIETCVNCAQPYYARGKDKLQAPLISAGLIADPNTVQALKNHPDFSSVFQIVIHKPRNGKTVLMEKESVQTALSGLQQQFGSAIKKQAEKTDENIRVFSDQQFELLKKFRDRALRDHEDLVRLIHNCEALKQSVATSASSGISTKAAPLSPTKASGVVNAVHGANHKSHATSAAMGITGRRSVSSYIFSSHKEVAASYDAEGVFNLEEMGDFPTEHPASEGESDTDHDDSGSHDEGIDIHRKKGSTMNLAQSLPVNVPGFSSGRLQLQPIEIKPDALDDDIIVNPMDIAASIKALARSVHGEAVFGDLPRPRFSTQI